MCETIQQRNPFLCTTDERENVEVVYAAMTARPASRAYLVPQRTFTRTSCRCRELEMDHHGTVEERTAIADALNGLKVLRQERT